jgi:hypothetical protein
MILICSFLTISQNPIVSFHFQYDRSGAKDRQGDKNPQSRAKAIIKKLDVSGDKKLSREEFVNGYVLTKLSIFI